MAKTIGEYLGKAGFGKKYPEENRSYFLDDKLEENPTRICPRCSFGGVERLHTHNVDGIDYECKSCGLRYEICYFRRCDD